ncbi:MAG: SpoVR family protein [Candidatus Liptonbacteria bacterium]|nr:SpoVR family protein [Candidatus Liptonbacteria bacterium]
METSLEEIKTWNPPIERLARNYGLDTYPQEFEICDYEEMLSYMVYLGMPSHYPHWSYGKGFEKLKTLYDYGLSGLPYEMVINSDPCLAYLMRENTLALQILTMAHVYGHNDFFKNNDTFKTTRADMTIERFKSHANRIRHYISDASIGLEKVEAVLDAAHAVSMQCRRNLSIKKVPRKEQEDRALSNALPRADGFRNIHKRPDYTAPDLTKVPLEPDEDILLFIRDNNRDLQDWARDVLTIVHEQAQYFIPQIDTKIMNEGWASFWHKTILNTLNLPQALHMEFLVRHSQVLCPSPGGMNPYFVGNGIWCDIVHRNDEAYVGKICEKHQEMYERNGSSSDLGKKTGLQKVFEVREWARDSSFLDNFLTEELVRDFNLFEYQQKGNDMVVSEVASEDGWRKVKKTLVQNVGTGTIPVIKVEDANYRNNRILFLKHSHDGRDLQLEYAEKTLGYIKQLWGRGVSMETIVNGKATLCSVGDNGKLEISGI